MVPVRIVSSAANASFSSGRNGRLTELGRVGLVERSVCDGPPVSVSYALTPAGQALLPVLRGLTEWAADNLPG
jgi:DNA-binding HxlR family transcriptional regulator